VGAMALVTAFPGAARGSHGDNSAGPGAAGPHSAHVGGSSGPPQPPRAGERFLAVPPVGATAVREQDPKTPGLGWQCFGGTGVAGAEVEEGDAAWVDTWARPVTMKVDLTHLADGCRTTRTPEKRLT
jgi:hypothetical protein